jgi:hypothetical protein
MKGATMSTISDTSAATPFHPIGLVVSDDLHRSRLTVFFRWILVIPHLVVLLAWSILAAIALFIAWIIGIFTGRLPEWFHDTLSGYLRYLTRVNAYLLLLANPWPTFGRTPYPVDVHIEPPAEQSRLTIAFRMILAIPALLISYVFRIVNNLIAFLGWFYSLIFGRMHEGMRNTSAWLFKYELQTYAYIYLLTSRYPTLAGAPELPTQ